jgi:hypothetical protein
MRNFLGKIRQDVWLGLFSHLAVIISCVGFGLALAGYAVLGLSSRYYSDDFCLTSGYLTQGFWSSIVNLYNTWSPRFSGAFVVNLSELLGRDVIRWWTTFVILSWVVAITWAVLEIGRTIRIKIPLILAILFGEAAVFFSIVEAPQFYQAFLWRVGIVTYTLPLVFLVLLVAMIFHSTRRALQGHRIWGGIGGAALLAFFAGGFSETYVALQTGILILACLAVWLGLRSTQRRVWFRLILSALIGSLVSTFVVIAAPGNAVRLSYMPPRPDLFNLIRMTVTNTIYFIYTSLSDHAFVILLSFLLPMTVTYALTARKVFAEKLNPLHLNLALFTTPVLAAVLILGVCAPSALVELSYPEGRIMIEARFIMVLMVLMEGVLFGLALGQLHQWANRPAPVYLQVTLLVTFVLISAYGLYDLRKVSIQIPFYQDRAALWDDRDAFIRAEINSGNIQVNYQNGQAASFDDFSGLYDMTPLPDFWTNRCAADYYGIESLTVNAP